MSGSAHAEWTKLRTVPSTPWLLLGAIAATVTVGAGYADSFSVAQCRPAVGCIVDGVRISLTGVQLGQAVVAVLALLSITNEFGTRMVCTTLTTDPRRVRVLLCKAGVVTAMVLAAGAVGVAGALVAGRAILGGNGLSPYSLVEATTLRAGGGTVLYLALIGLLSLGIGAIVRDTAGALTTVLTLLYVSPLMIALISDPQWRDRLGRFAPTSAGQAIQSTIGLDEIPIGPWAGLGVLAGWAGAALLLGAVRFRFRDA